MYRLLLASAALAASATLAHAHGPTPQKVDETVDIKADPKAVWAVAGDFAGLSKWDSVLKSTREVSNKERTLVFKNGEKLVESVDEYDTGKMTYTYRMSDPNIKALPGELLFGDARRHAEGRRQPGRMVRPRLSRRHRQRAARGPNGRGCQIRAEHAVQDRPRGHQGEGRGEVMIARALGRAFALLALLTLSTAVDAAPGPGARIAVASQDDGSVTEIDPSSLEVVKRIALSRGPANLALSPDGTELFVSHPDGGTVDTIATATGHVDREIAVKGEPFGIAAGPGCIYVADWERAAVTCVDPVSGATMATFAVGRSPANATMDAARHRLYVADRESDDVTIVDTASRSVVGRIATGSAPFALAVSPAGDRLYVANVHDGTLAVIDTAASRRIAVVPVGAMPYGVAVTPDGATILVTNQHSNSVSLVDAKTLKTAGTIAVGRYPEGIIATADGRAYVANWFSGDVSVLDLAQRREIKRIKIGDGPRYLAAIPAGNQARP